LSSRFSIALQAAQAYEREGRKYPSYPIESGCKNSAKNAFFFFKIKISTTYWHFWPKA
jgi:hypothetical protein